MINKVIILTEGSSDIGFGHITRCSAMYEIFQGNGFDVELIINGDETINYLLFDKNYKIFNWLDDFERIIDIINHDTIVVIDSYLTNFRHYDLVYRKAKLLVSFDDTNRLNYPGGIVINGTLGAEKFDYPKNDRIKYLLGVDYMLLRKEFRDVSQKKINENVKSIMITMGGDDIRNLTPKILKEICKHFPDLIKNVIIAKGYKNKEEIKNNCDKNTNLIFFPDANGMLNTMLESNIAISAAGQTLYELACIGVPSIAIGVAENQKYNIKGLIELGFISNEIWYYDSDMINTILICVSSLLKFSGNFPIINMDGQGAGRIFNVISNYLETNVKR